MTQPKRIKKIICSLIAISCVMVAWLWLTRSPAVGVIPTNPVPSVSMPAPTGNPLARTINPVGAANPAVLANAPTAPPSSPTLPLPRLRYVSLEPRSFVATAFRKSLKIDGARRRPSARSAPRFRTSPITVAVFV